MHGQMQYMENHFDKRLDPTKLVEGSKSVVSLLLNYFPSEVQEQDSFKISKYAFGTDYHFVIKDKLKSLLHFIQDEIGDVHGRAFVDSAPVLDKAWAAKSGLGWIGKHSNLLTQQVGSFYFIAELIIDLDLEYDGVTTDHCEGKMDDWMFGCDVCQDVCPWNRFSKAHNEPLFNPHPELLDMTKKDWEEITEDTFRKVFKNSPVKRTKFSGLKRNINFLKD